MKFDTVRDKKLVKTPDLSLEKGANLKEALI